MDLTPKPAPYPKDDWMADGAFVADQQAQAQDRGPNLFGGEPVQLYFQRKYGQRALHHQTRLLSALAYLERHRGKFLDGLCSVPVETEEALMLAMHAIMERVRDDQLGNNWHPGEVKALAARLYEAQLKNA